jgi:hypothetical protein
LFDRNVPVKVRGFLSKHQGRTIAEMNWSPRLKNGELLNAAEAAGFDVLLTCDSEHPLSAKPNRTEACTRDLNFEPLALGTQLRVGG